MATVTGYTAARMKAIEDSAIVDGTVSGDNLILIKHDGTTIDAGSVRGPQGIQGPGGGDISDVMELLCPVGTMVPFAGINEPTGWRICDGASLLRSDYTALYNAIGTTHGAADQYHFNIPDMRLRVPVGKTLSGTGSTLGAKGGSKDAVIVTHGHDHSHTASSNTTGDHGHSIASDSGERIVVTMPSPMNQHIVGGAAGGGLDLNVVPSHVDIAGGHSHTIYVAKDNTFAGASGVDANLPPYVVINYIIRY